MSIAPLDLNAVVGCTGGQIDVVEGTSMTKENVRSTIGCATIGTQSWSTDNNVTKTVTIHVSSAAD